MVRAAVSHPKRAAALPVAISVSAFLLGIPVLAAAPVPAAAQDAGVTATSGPGATKPTFNAVWSDGKGHAWAVGVAGVAAETLDWGGTWRALRLPTKQDLSAIWRAPGGPFFIAGKGGVVLRSEDNGRTWQRLQIGRRIVAKLDPDDRKVGISFRGITGDARQVYFVGGGPEGGSPICLRAPLHASTLDTTFPCEVDEPHGVWGGGSDLFVRGGIYDCHGGDYSAVDRSPDGGKHWTRMKRTWSEVPPGPFWVTKVGASYEMNDNGVFTHWEDGLNPGKAWTEFKTGRVFRHLAVWGNDDGDLYIVGEGPVILHSRDGGATFAEGTVTPGR